MAHFGGETAKNPPWFNQGQTVAMAMSQQGQIQPQIVTQIGNTGAVTMLQYPQTQVYQQQQIGQLQQSGITMQTVGTIGANHITTSGMLPSAIQQAPGSIQPQQLFSQMGTIAYPTRTLIAAPYGQTTTTQQTVGITSNVSNAPANSSEISNQRVFTGTITKIQDNFGFVDGEVFFQTSCCQESNPRLGDRVLVEANYNANMPFKWNATRIQILPPDNPLKPLPPGTGRGRRFSSTPHNSFTDTPEAQDFTGGVDDFDRRNRGGFKRNRRNDNFNRKRRREEPRPRSKEKFREEKEKEKEKENGKEKEQEQPKSPPPRRISKVSRSRKAVNATRSMGQIALDMPEADVLELKKRYSNLYIPSDFIMSTFKWVEVFPPHRALTLERPCSFHVMHKDVDPVVENNVAVDPPDADYLFSAKVMLLSMPELDELYQKSCGLKNDKEESHDDYDRDYVHPTHMINFLVGLRGKNETMAIGGPWSPLLDGPNPAKDPTVLIKTAIRTSKALTGIDLTNCSQWYRFVEIYYHRAETVHKGKNIPARVETVVLYLPDVWNCLPTRLEWDGLHLNYKRKLDYLLAQKEDAEGVDKAACETPKKEPTHHSKLDPKNMKIMELREELEARNLPSKGLTSQLVARLTKVLKAEQDKEEQEYASKTEAERAAAEKEKEKEEERKKKEEEDKKRLAEKDKKLLEKRYTLPEKSHILIHPSRVAKSGKFDCNVMSLSLLLDYRQDDTKEHSFEVSLFAEIFNGMLMRDFGFRIYKSLVEAPEKPKEEKEDKDGKKKTDKENKDDSKRDENKDSRNNDDNISDESKKEKKDSDKKKKDQTKLSTFDPFLLLCFVYFDQNHHDYLNDKDIEDLLFSLGINLSRAQIKKLLQKVESRGLVHYRRLTDKAKDDLSNKSNVTTSTKDLMTLALGNKRLFPVFDNGILPNKCRKDSNSVKKSGSTDHPSGCVIYNGSLLDISKLLKEFRQSEVSRLKSEKVLDKLESDNDKLKDVTRRSSSTISKLSSELEDFKERLTNTNSELNSIESTTKWYYSLMNEMYEKLSPVFHSKRNVKDEELKESKEDGIENVKENITLDNESNSDATTIKEESDVKKEGT